MELKGKKINFLGDSITEGIIGISNNKNTFISRIADLTGAESRNYGVSGTKIQQMIFQYENESKNESFIQRVD